MPVSAKDAVEPQEPLQTSRARLNPFAFPSETQLRVVLLSVTLLSLAWSTGFLFTSAIVAPRLGLPPLLSLQLPNLDIWEINKGHSPLPLPHEVAEHERRLSERLDRMTDPAEVAKSRDSLRQLAEACRGTLRILSAYLVIPTLFTLILAVVIFFLYLTHPARVRRSRGLAELKPDDKSEFQAAVRALLEEARQVQLSEEGRAPRFPRLAFGRGTQGDAQAFGLPWRPWIALTRAVPTIFRKDLLGHGRPYRMRALVLHELAHFANGDVARSFWAESTWIVLAPLLFLQVLSLVLLARTPGNSTLGVPLVAPIFQTVLSLLLAELVRRSILRDREFYADLRVALTWKTERSLQESLMPQLAVAPLSDSFPVRPDSRVERLKLWFQRLWAKHPAPEERWLIIQNPSRLFRVTSDLPLASGLLLGQLSFLVVWASSLLIMMAASLGILRTISTTLRLLREQGAVTALEYHYRFGSFLGVALILVGGLTLLLGGAYLLAGTVGVQIQRESMEQLHHGKGGAGVYTSLIRPAVLLAIGLEGGFLLMPFAETASARLTTLGAALLWLILASALFWIWMVTARFCSRVVLGSQSGGRPPERKRRRLTLILAVLLTGILLAVLGGHFWLWGRINPGAAFFFLGSGLLSFCAPLAILLFAMGIQQVRRCRPENCPSCGSSVAGGVGRTCASCGRYLAAWLLAAPLKVQRIQADQDRQEVQGISLRKGALALATLTGVFFQFEIVVLTFLASVRMPPSQHANPTISEVLSDSPLVRWLVCLIFLLAVLQLLADLLTGVLYAAFHSYHQPPRLASVSFGGAAAGLLSRFIIGVLSSGIVVVQSVTLMALVPSGQDPRLKSTLMIVMIGTFLLSVVALPWIGMIFGGLGGAVVGALTVPGRRRALRSARQHKVGGAP